MKIVYQFEEDLMIKPAAPIVFGWLWAFQWGVLLVVFLAVWLVLKEILVVKLGLSILVLASALLFWLVPLSLQYKLTGKGIQIRRLSGKIFLPYQDFKVIVSKGCLDHRVMGTAIVGYNAGIFLWRGPEHQSVKAMSSRESGGVLLECEEATYFITPADPQAFLRKIEQIQKGMLIE